LTGERIGCDETRSQGDDALLEGNTEMNAVRKNEFVAVPNGTCNEASRALEARPLKNPPSHAEMRAEIKRRFSRTLAYLAK
jgi:hypothetical protein